MESMAKSFENLSVEDKLIRLKIETDIQREKINNVIVAHNGVAIDQAHIESSINGIEIFIKKIDLRLNALEEKKEESSINALELFNNELDSWVKTIEKKQAEQENKIKKQQEEAKFERQMKSLQESVAIDLGEIKKNMESMEARLNEKNESVEARPNEKIEALNGKFDALDKKIRHLLHAAT